MSLSERQVEVWSRQIILQELGGRGQERLLAARLRLIGTDLAAATAATYLAGAGVGTLEVEAALRNAPPFAPLTDRVPGIRILTHPDSTPPDILLISSAAVPPATAGRLGSLLIDHTADGSASLMLLPRDGAACPECALRPAPATEIDPAAASIAGSLAALVATRWIAKIEQETECRRWVLAPGNAAWDFAPVETRTPCPSRGHAQ